MNKITTAEEAIAVIPDGARIMWGGFFHGGLPQLLIRTLHESGRRNLSVISLDSGDTNCASFEFLGTDQVVEFTASHVGRNPHITRRANAKELKLNLVPQGTLVERIRAAGYGLGGILTPTGVGTLVEEGKQVIEVNGKKYLLELPIFADFAFVRATVADEGGNLVFHGTTRNYNTSMAMAAKNVIAEVEKIVKIGELDPDLVHVPGVLVDELVLGDAFNG